MEIRKVTHPQYQDTFRKGFETKLAEINQYGFEFARDKHNRSYPPGQKITPLERFYLASGETEALLSTL